MTNQEFIKKLSLSGSASPFMQYSAEELEAKIHKTYPDRFDLKKIVDFFLTTGALTFVRFEKGSGDKLTFGLNWIRTVEFWSDISCVVNAIGNVENCAGRIERFFISEQGKLYNQDHKLIAENTEDFLEYITTVEYDFHPEIKQRTYDMLRFFGWYEGRHIDTTTFEREMNRRGIELSKKQLDFFSEFSGLYFSFDSDCWGFDTLDEILTKDKYYAEPSSPCEYKTILCGKTMGGPIAIDGDGIIKSFYAIPLGRTTMECINHLCEGVSEDCEWIAPGQGDQEQGLDDLSK